MTLETKVNMGPPKINRKASRKLKSSWRKNIDITEEETALENERFEERMGGSFSKRETKDLFIMDSEGGENDKIPKKQEKKVFSCWKHLERLPGAADPLENKRRSGIRKKKITKLSKKVQQRTEKDQTKRAIVSIANRTKAKEEEKKKDEEVVGIRRQKFDFDLWDTEEKKDANMENEWVTPETKTHTDIWSRKFTPKEKRNKKPITLVPNIEVHSGQSYNPTLEDHQDLLWKAAYVEIKKEKEERRLQMHLTGMFPNQKDAPTQKSYTQEMSVGIPELGGEEDESDDEEASDEEDEGYSKKMRRAKTQKEKRDRRLRKEAEILAAKEKKERIAMEKIVSIKTYKKEFKVKDKESEVRQARNMDKAIEKLKGPAKLGGKKFEPNEIEIKLTDELTGNLRKLKPEGSLLMDRMKSLQKRRIIEPIVQEKEKKQWTKKKLIRHKIMGFEAEDLKIKNQAKIQKRKVADRKGNKRSKLITPF